MNHHKMRWQGMQIPYSTTWIGDYFPTHGRMDIRIDHAGARVVDIIAFRRRFPDRNPLEAPMISAQHAEAILAMAENIEQALLKVWSEEQQDERRRGHEDDQ